MAISELESRGTGLLGNCRQKTCILLHLGQTWGNHLSSSTKMLLNGNTEEERLM